MQLRNIFVSAFFLTAVFLSCNRHVSSSVDWFDTRVAGDTVGFYPTMSARLREDSLERNPAYYYRINRVKREEITDGDSREVNEYDRFGHQLTEVHYLGGELFWRDIDVYNRYGNIARSVHTFYDDGEEGNVYLTTFSYEPDGWTLGQRPVRTDMHSPRPVGETDLDYSYVYSYKNHLLDAETRFKNGKCTEKVYFIYNEFDKPEQQLIVEFNTMGPDTTFRNYKYDSLQREINWSETCNGVLLSDHITEYNSDGRESKYSSIEYEPYSSIIFEYFYLPNGLLSHRIVTYNGKVDTERYRYSYY